MAEIINLRRARKAKKRDGAAQNAAANRVAFGRTGAERRQTEAEKAREASRLDGHRREPEGEPDA